MVQVVRGGAKEGLMPWAEVSGSLESGDLYRPGETILYPVVRIFNVYPRLHGRKLHDISDYELNALTDGVDAVWAMGLHKRSPASATLSRRWIHEYRDVIKDIRPNDVVGSAFAIHDFLPDPALVSHAGSWEEVIAFRKRLHKKGKKLYADVICNHLAPDHPWVRQHPDWFIHASEEQFQEKPQDFFTIQANDGKTYHIACGKSDKGGGIWSDTAQLNLANEQAQEALIAVAGMYGEVFDGGRIDLAMLLVPDKFLDLWGDFLTDEQKDLLNMQKNNFGRQLLPRIVGAAQASAEKEGRRYTAIAETYSIYGHDGNILGSVDQIYMKGWYDHLLRVIREGAPLPDLAKSLQGNMRNLRQGALFTGNHDEVPPVREFRHQVIGTRRLPDGRDAPVWECKNPDVGVESSLAAAAIMALLPSGAFLVDDTQREGFDGERIPVQVGRLPSFQENAYVAQFYTMALSLKHTKLFQEGRYSIAPTKHREGQANFDFEHPAILPIRVESENQREGIIVCSNVTQSRQGCLLPIPGDFDIEVFDIKQGKWLPKEIIDHERNGGFAVVLDGYQVQLVRYKGK